MSETDDTDDLLLIPPDIFLSEHDLAETYTTGPYLTIVDDLITQVHRLEHRVNYIQATEMDSSFSSDIREEYEKYGSCDDILKTREVTNISTYSTPQKPRVKYKMSSLSPAGDASRRVEAQNRSPGQKKMLNDIDRYINRGARSKLVYHPHGEAQNHDPTKSDVIEVNGKFINLREIEDMLGNIESQKISVENKLASTDRLNVSRFENSKGINCLSVNKVASPTATYTSDAVMGDQSGTSTSSGSTQTTARRNPVSPRKLLSKQNNLSDVAMLSLRDLWGKKHEETTNNLKEKLEEEKLRREHCEQLIQKLQSRLLELEEKVSVAVKVDHAKDSAILRYHDAWEQVSEKILQLQKERDDLEVTIRQLEEKKSFELAEATKKIAHYENEASKALNLAHGSKEKVAEIEQLNSDLTDRLSSAEAKIYALESKHVAEVERNKQFHEIIVQKELEIKENKAVMLESKKEIQQSRNAVDHCQAEFATMKTEYKQLQSLVNEKHAYIRELEAAKRNLSSDNENLRTLQKKIQEDLSKNKEIFEKNKVELKNFYQQQVEIVVRDKLKEFQEQLDRAETSLQEEIKSRELSIAKTAAGHIQQLSQKHVTEINLLEEKHKEEVRLYQAKLSQAQQEAEQLQSKFQQMHEKRASIARQLHKVMENQWMEALKIINSGKSPLPPAGGTIDQLQSLKSKSYSNLEEVLSDRLDEDKLVPTTNTTLMTEESGEAYRLEETPLTSRLHRGRKQIENDLQKYIQLLLNNQPAKNTNANVIEEKSGKPENSSNEKQTWSSDLQEEELKNKSMQQKWRNAKPPWK